MLLSQLHPGSLSALFPRCFIFPQCPPPWLKGCPIPCSPGPSRLLSAPSDPWDRLVFGLCAGHSFPLRLCLSLATLPSFSLVAMSFVGRSLLCPFDSLAPLCRGRMKGPANCSSDAWLPFPASSPPRLRGKENQGKSAPDLSGGFSSPFLGVIRWCRSPSPAPPKLSRTCHSCLPVPGPPWSADRCES